MTNKEEAEWLMSWWKNYGQGIVFAVVIGLIIGFGWKYWHNSQQQKAMHASVLYQQTQPTMTSSPAVLKASQKALQKEFPKSLYTQLTYLQQSNSLVKAKKYKQANALLNKIIANPKLPALGQMAQLKVAQILIEMKKPHQYGEALIKIFIVAYKAAKWAFYCKYYSGIKLCQ